MKKTAFNIPTIDQSLRRDVDSGRITIDEAALELARSGWFMGIVDVGKTRKFLYHEN